MIVSPDHGIDEIRCTDPRALHAQRRCSPLIEIVVEEESEILVKRCLDTDSFTEILDQDKLHIAARATARACF